MRSFGEGIRIVNFNDVCLERESNEFTRVFYTEIKKQNDAG